MKNSRARMRGRGDPEQEAAGQRDGGREQQNRGVERRLHERRQRHGTVCHEHAHGHVGQANPREPAERREDQALGHELTEQPDASRPERRPDGDLLLSCFGPA